jgi:hypothetical protein
VPVTSRAGARLKGSSSSLLTWGWIPLYFDSLWLSDRLRFISFDELSSSMIKPIVILSSAFS